jgi:hypothetical protein
MCERELCLSVCEGVFLWEHVWQYVIVSEGMIVCVSVSVEYVCDYVCDSMCVSVGNAAH